MSSNLILYPLDYVFGSTGSSSSGVGGGGSQTATVETAINTIQVQARDTALKQSHTRRIGGQNAIDLQNRLLLASPGVLPLYQVTAAAVAPPFLGTQGIFGGGRGHGLGQVYANMARLAYSGETYLPINIFLSVARTYMATISDASAGKFCAGFSNIVGAAGIIDRVSYAELRNTRIAAILANTDGIAAGGMGTKTYGYMGGGIFQNRFLRSINRYSHALDTVSYLGEILSSYRAAPHNGASSRFNGYLFAGPGFATNTSPPNVFDWFAPATLLLNADKFTYATETSAVLGITLDNYHIAHAMMGYEVKAYIAGGGSNAYGSNFFPYSNSIYAFTISGETGAPLSATLADAKICCDGTSSQAAGYVVGGDTPTTNWVGSKTIDRLTFATETTSRIGSALPQAQADQAVISDFSPSFSY